MVMRDARHTTPIYIRVTSTSEEEDGFGFCVRSLLGEKRKFKDLVVGVHSKCMWLTLNIGLLTIRCEFNKFIQILKGIQISIMDF